MNRPLLPLLSLSLVLLAPGALAAPQAPPGNGPPPGASSAEPAPPPPPAYRASSTQQEAATPYLAPQWGVGGRLGPRYVWARDAGLDPFASNDLLIGFQLEGLLRVWHDGPLSAWVTGGWSTGGMASSGKARELNSSLLFHDLQAGIEGRYALWKRLTLQARIAPGARYVRTRLTSTELPYNLVASRWTWSMDAAAGASLLLGAVGDDAWPTVRFWLSAEGGYSMSGRSENKLEVDTDDEDERRRHAATTLPSFSLSGTMMRVTFGMTF